MHGPFCCNTEEHPNIFFYFWLESFLNFKSLYSFLLSFDRILNFQIKNFITLCIHKIVHAKCHATQLQQGVYWNSTGFKLVGDEEDRQISTKMVGGHTCIGHILNKWNIIRTVFETITSKSCGIWCCFYALYLDRSVESSARGTR